MKWLVTKKDGREILNLRSAKGHAEYKRRALEMWERDEETCCLCGRYLPLWVMSYEHRDGRGSGGSLRDDRIEFNGVSHILGNMRKGSTKMHRYMQLPLEQRVKNCMEAE